MVTLHRKPPLEPERRAEVLARATAFIREHWTCYFATYRPDGYARLYGMGYLLADDGWTFFMSTFRDMRKHLDIVGNRRVSFFLVDQSIRKDHFIQIDALARELSDEELAPWQERRFQKWPHEIEAFAKQGKPWVGWLFDPVRMRVNGYVNDGPWYETPVVFTRAELGLPPLP
jgi:general stress protein 26